MGPYRILGIDPGSRITGYGVLEVDGRDVRYLASGCIRPAGGSFVERLADIYRGVEEIIAVQQPAELALEEVFLARNPASAL